MFVLSRTAFVKAFFEAIKNMIHIYLSANLILKHFRSYELFVCYEDLLKCVCGINMSEVEVDAAAIENTALVIWWNISLFCFVHFFIITHLLVFF